MRKALLVVLSVSACVVAGGVATAAPKVKPVCNLVVDAAADASVDPAGVAKDDALDVLSVDVASNKSDITAVLRVKKLASSASGIPAATNWSVNFSADGTDFSMAGHTTVAGTQVFDTAYAGATGGSLYGPGTTGVFDTAKNEVRITAPLSLLSAQAYIKAGKTKVTGIGGTTGPELLVPDVSGTFGPTIFSWNPATADGTEAGRDYLAGSPSCVVPGK
ncbi:MAG: hypothetical protein JJD92_11840 [Frankiaceae bacterium]|nr:hypothetical protein [Frankiaceae bacterium]